MTISPQFILDTFLLLFGLLFGSFANVVVWRVPRGESIVTPPSRCPSCGREIRWYDNVPVVSWLALRGRCRDCGAPISLRYPVVEALSGAGWLAAGLAFGLTWRTAAAVALFWLLLVLSAIDIDLYRLPNPLVGILAAVGLAGAALAQVTGARVVPLVGLAQSGPLSEPLVASLAGALVGAALSASIAGVYALVRGRTGLGAGDVKLLGSIGLFTGPYVLMSLVVGSIAGAVFGVASAIRAREDAATHRIPFGPFLAAGAVVTVLWGPILWAWYLGILGAA